MLSIPTGQLHPKDASIATRHALNNMPFSTVIQLVFGWVAGCVAMLVNAPIAHWRMPCLRDSRDLRLPPVARHKRLFRFKRHAFLRAFGDMRFMARPPQPLGSQDVWAPHINGPGAFIGANPLIAGENFFTQLAIAALGNIAAQQLPALAPARFIPMHLLHERSRTGDFPGTSRLPAAFRAGGIASIGIERVPSSLAQVRFGQAAFALMRPANGSTGCPVLDELAAARPVYRCQLRVSEEIEDALRLDSCVEWLQDDGSSSEVKRTYADTELEDFEFLMSGSELQSLIAAFFVRGLEAS